jgi:hypothetical protein
MRWQVGLRTIVLLVAVGAALAGSAWKWALAQDGNGGGNGDGEASPATAGVMVDAEGVLRRHVHTDPTGQLTRQRLAAARATLTPEIATFSPLRKVSLNRLEKAMRDSGMTLSEEMRYLAGLLRVRYVFYYPETKDIVLAGPAEGWLTDLSGRAIGLTSRRPVLQLQDLAVALRAFPPGEKSAGVIGCSIDPTEQGLAQMQRFLRSVPSVAPSAQALQASTPRIVQGLRTSLGYQTVSVLGVPADTHFAQVMVEADYRMKLIGIGLERPPVRLASFIERVSPAQVSRNALFRWYFVPEYQCVRRSDDGTAIELVGDGVRLIGENELVNAAGQRQAAARASNPSDVFVTSFTKSYSALAERSPVYAELRNLIDLAVAAAYIQQEDFYGKAGWSMEILGDESKYSVRTYNAPKHVESAINAVWKGRQLMTPIGGGVEIQAREALNSQNVQQDAEGKVAALREETGGKLPDDRWWWD